MHPGRPRRVLPTEGRASPAARRITARRQESDHANLASAVVLGAEDLLLWLQATDRKVWEPDTVAASDGSLRQEVILTFPKPKGASQVNLIANAATGLWGSFMIKKMVELHGRDTANWLTSLDGDAAALKNIHAWGEREGTYRLPIEVEEPSGWVVRGALPNGGPMLAEDRVIPMDVSRATGTQLRIRMRPPVGYWESRNRSLRTRPAEDSPRWSTSRKNGD